MKTLFVQPYFVLRQRLYLVVVVQMLFRRLSLIFHPISHPEEIGLCKNNRAKKLVWDWSKQSPFWSSSYHMAVNNAFLYFFFAFVSIELCTKIIFGSINLNSTPHLSKTITDKHRWQLPLASLTPLLYAMYSSAQQLVVQPHGTRYQTPHIYTHTLSDPNPDPATKILLFHSTQGKWQCTQPFHREIRISVTNSVGAEGEESSAEHVFWPHLESVACVNTQKLFLFQTYLCMVHYSEAIYCYQC